MIITKFSVGDTAWYAKCAHELIKKTCPTCFGKLEVTLILGDGDAVILPCEACGKGYEGPRGYIEEYAYVVEPIVFIITRMTINHDGSGNNIEYASGYNTYKDEDVFLTKEEALVRAKAKKERLDEEQRTRAECLKYNTNKNFSWNAAYHMREAKRLRSDALRHDEKAKRCKERSRNKGEE